MYCNLQTNIGDFTVMINERENEVDKKEGRESNNNSISTSTATKTARSPLFDNKDCMEIGMNDKKGEAMIPKNDELDDLARKQVIALQNQIDMVYRRARLQRIPISVQAGRNENASALSPITEEDDRTSTLTKLGSQIYDRQRWRTYFQRTDVRERFAKEVKRFVDMEVFEKSKFSMSLEEEKMLCLKAIHDNRIILPNNGNKMAFAEEFHYDLHQRMKKLRENSTCCARGKFFSKLTWPNAIPQTDFK